MHIIWFVSILLTLTLASQKKRSILGWLALSIFFGPIPLIILAFLPSLEDKARFPYSSGASSQNPQQLRDELNRIRNNLRALIDNLNILEVKIDRLQGQQSAPQPQQVNIPAQEPVPIIKETVPARDALGKTPRPVAKRSDVEMDLGKFWLNKAGITIFALGIAFLITYTFKYFGPAAKIAFGYLVAGALFIFGLRLEKKEKFLNYSRVLFGGAWAITYFTTYAMYNFEASKIIYSQLLDLLFLAVVAFGIIAHSLKYKSSTLTAVALFIGYFTSALGDVGYFSLANAGLLALVAIVLVYKMQWVRLIFVGILLTYLTHLAWVIKQISFSRVFPGVLNVENVYFFLDAGFLSIYWAMFTLAILGIRDKDNNVLENRLSAANFANFMLFFFMVYPKLHVFYPEHKFNFVFGLGLVYLVFAMIMETRKSIRQFISNIIIAVSLLTMAAPLKFLPYHTSVIWFVELPFLLLIGFAFERRIYRYLGFALSFVLFFKIMSVDWYLARNLNILGLRMDLRTFLSCVGFLSAALCYGFYRVVSVKIQLNTAERIIKNFFSGFACVYLTIFISKVVNPPWLTLGIALGSLAIFIIGALVLDKFVRWYALAILIIMGMRYCFIDRYHAASEWTQLLLTSGPLICAFFEYAIYRRLMQRSLAERVELPLSCVLFIAAASLFVYAVIVYALQLWISLTLAIAAILILLWGGISREKAIRYYALFVLFVAAFRVLFIDSYRDTGSLTQWALISLKMACAYAVYFIYNGMKKRELLGQDEKFIVSPLFYAGTFLIVCQIFMYIKDIWVSVALGIAGALLFIAGFLIRDKKFRIAGFIIFALTILRIVFVDLAGLPIIYKITSFIILGILFLAISFIYTRSYRDKQGTS